MNDERFDSWSKWIARGGSRRGLLRATAGALAAVAGLGAGARPRAGRAQADDLVPILHPLLGWTDAPVVSGGNYLPDPEDDGKGNFASIMNPERGIYYW